MTEKEIKDKAYRCDYPYGHGNHVKDAAEYGYLQGANDVLKSTYSEEDMIAAYWGGIEGSINDYSEAKTVGNEIVGIRAGKGAEQWLTKYKKNKK